MFDLKSRQVRPQRDGPPGRLRALVLRQSGQPPRGGGDLCAAPGASLPGRQRFGRKFKEQLDAKPGCPVAPFSYSSFLLFLFFEKGSPLN